MAWGTPGNLPKLDTTANQLVDSLVAASNVSTKSFTTVTPVANTGTGCTLNVLVSGGVIQATTSVVSGGTGYPPYCRVALLVTGGDSTGVVFVDVNASGVCVNTSGVVAGIAAGGTTYTNNPTNATTAYNVFGGGSPTYWAGMNCASGLNFVIVIPTPGPITMGVNFANAPAGGVMQMMIDTATNNPISGHGYPLIVFPTNYYANYADGYQTLYTSIGTNGFCTTNGVFGTWWYSVPNGNVYAISGAGFIQTVTAAHVNSSLYGLYDPRLLTAGDFQAAFSSTFSMNNGSMLRSGVNGYTLGDIAFQRNAAGVWQIDDASGSVLNLNNGAGSGCTITITTTGGVVTGISSIAAGGSGYFANVASGNRVTLALTGGNGDARVSCVTTGDAVTAASILNGGTGYSNATVATTIAIYRDLKLRKLISSDSSGSVGYGAGSGGAVTQATNRTTGVTINTPTGAITLFSQVNTAVSAATAQSFTVTCNAVGANDTVVMSQKSGTDLYEIFVTNVAAGSFKVTNYSTGGTTNEAPVFNFCVVKGSAS